MSLSCYALRQTHILMRCTCNCSMHISAPAPLLLHAHFCNCSMHIQHMQLLHAHSAPACICTTRSGSPHNVLHSLVLSKCTVVQASCTASCYMWFIRNTLGSYSIRSLWQWKTETENRLDWSGLDSPKSLNSVK